MIITTTGYFGTGSSAITDLLSEFEGILSTGHFEQRFLHDPWGISDLEYHLVENFNRHNSGYALKRFEKFMDSLSGKYLRKGYYQIYGENFKKLCSEYISSLKYREYRGYWHQDVIDKGRVRWFISRLLSKVYISLVRNSERGLNELPRETTYLTSETEESFLIKTKKFTSSLFGTIANDNEIVVIDQLTPPNNIDRYLRYIDNCKVFLVDRDPRDLYVLNKYVWKSKVVPTVSVEIFCDWFLNVRQDQTNVLNKGYENIIFIQFEDLVYDYQNTISKITSFLGIEYKNHSKYRFFDPKISINNTNLFTEYAPKIDITYIENRLKEYIYSFPNLDS
jgi:hypothetical protein